MRKVYVSNTQTVLSTPNFPQRKHQPAKVFVIVFQVFVKEVSGVIKWKVELCFPKECLLLSNCQQILLLLENRSFCSDDLLCESSRGGLWMPSGGLFVLLLPFLIWTWHPIRFIFWIDLEPLISCLSSTSTFPLFFYIPQYPGIFMGKKSCM